MTTTQLSIDAGPQADRVASLEHALAGELTNVLEYAAGRRELIAGDFEAGLETIRHLAAEIRWLTLGQQPVPF